ncbi:hypothetical protein [Loigolactobacillus zhaoyuanensis]|uniref:hypothetical protein n=1 Tax=Loigolactobacillus zhaoyuanensis TaxID=2486017 RepID=UPI000F73ADC8|nr:hypothetical protein [Loigolactobacillus zhaoyuanensis]
MEYSTKSIPFSVYPADLAIGGLKKDSIEWLLDVLMLVSSGMYIQKGGVPPLPKLRPYNCLVATSSKFYYFGITYSGAQIKQTSLIFIKEAYSDDIEMIRKGFVDTANNELGWNGPIMVLKLSRNDSNVPFLNDFILNSRGDSRKTWQELSRISDEEHSNTGKASWWIINIVKSCEYFVNELFREAHRMKINPIFQARDLTIDEKQIFYALEFSEKRLAIFDIVKQCLASAFDVNVVKSGSIINPSQQGIMENIWIGINVANFVIVDISEKNPNVFYELGICHTLGKKTIILCDQESYVNDFAEKLPFDIHGNETIFYNNSISGADNLKRQITLHAKAYINNESVVTE